MEQTLADNFWSEQFLLLTSKTVLFIIKIRIFQFFGFKPSATFNYQTIKKLKEASYIVEKNLVCILYQKLMSPHCAVIMILPQCWLKTTFCVVVK